MVARNVKAIIMLSGGIDSPTAAHMLQQQGWELVGLHMDNRPFTDDREIEKTEALAKHLGIPLWIAPHGGSQVRIARNADRHLQCLLCRRMMYRTAAELAKQVGADAIINGESLGQVASQTLPNLAVIDEVCDVPILRPLIGHDKVEIERGAREAGTFDISTLPGLCCTIVPEKPATAASLPQVERWEAELPLGDMVGDSVGGLVQVI
ncbi:MAG: 7-cyano-7-deazaguanine synthase [Candidatus Poseidoniia archaeon]|jgi:thiamine biosynthesis protein ThiI|nr:7-cyano-7-deazaguanine synthase [Candidatus Poseidoniia archaeon]|tara:strand:- start:1910 stop:2533 length:624 start_codon:yes stop_codon:yes gene_type:complete